MRGLRYLGKKATMPGSSWKQLPFAALASSIAVSVLFVLSPAARAQSTLEERAAAEYEVQHFAEALSLYEQLARDGSSRAAEMAGTMLLCGEALYGQQVPRDQSRAAMLLKQAAVDGRPVAALLLKRASAARQAASTVAAEEPVDSWSEPAPFGAAFRAD